MSRAERDKGQRGQRDVRRLFEAHGWTMTATSPTRRGAAGTCDFIATRAGVVLAVEVKNQAVLRLPLWRRQTEANAPTGCVPVLVYKHEHVWQSEWRGAANWNSAVAVAFAQDFGYAAVAA